LSVYNWRFRSASGVPGAELAALSGTRQVFVDGAMMIAMQYCGIHHRALCRACRIKWNFLSARTSRYYFSLSVVSDDGKSLPPSKNVCSCVGLFLVNPPLDCEMAG
jgi:hypothetical protein